MVHIPHYRWSTSHTTGGPYPILQVVLIPYYRWSISHTTGGPYPTLQVVHIPYYRWSLSHTTGGPYPILQVVHIPHYRGVYHTRPMQYLDNILYRNIFSIEYMEVAIFSIMGIRCFPICYHDNCHKDCERV